MAKARTRAGKPARRKTTPRRPSQGRRRQVQLKPVFNRLTRSIAQLKRAEQTREVKAAILRLTRCVRSINEICAPDMIVPLHYKG